MNRAQFDREWSRVQRAAIAARLGTLTHGAARRARRAELRLRRVEHEILANLDWMHALALGQGRVTYRDPVCEPREFFRERLPA